MIRIIELATAPHLYLETDYILAENSTSEELKSGRIPLGYEGNTTAKIVGIVYLCDYNRDDELDILYINEDGNMTYDFSEINGSHPEGVSADYVARCLTSNTR